MGKEPSLPMNMLEILESPCPIWPNKKVAGTHLLTLIPEKINGKSLTLDYLQDLAKNPKAGGNKTDYSRYNEDIKNEHGSRVSGSTYWVLMTKNVLPNTRNKIFDSQLSELNTFAAKAPKITGLGEYKTPKVLEVAVSLFMEYVRSGNRFYTHSKGIMKQRTYTKCEEAVNRGQWRVIIGDFAASGLDVYYFSHWGSEFIGLGGLRNGLDF